MASFAAPRPPDRPRGARRRVAGPTRRSLAHRRTPHDPHARPEAGAPALEPVFREVLADLETPLTAYLKIAGQPSFLLESVEQGERVARYSFLGTGARRRFEARGDRLAITEGAAARRSTRATRCACCGTRTVRATRPAPTAAGLLERRRWGTPSYDLVRLYERLPDANPDELGIPDLCFVEPEVVRGLRPPAAQGLRGRARRSAATRRPRPRPGAGRRHLPAPARPAAGRARRPRRASRVDVHQQLHRRGLPRGGRQARWRTSRPATSSRWSPASGSPPTSACTPSPSTARCARSTRARTSATSTSGRSRWSPAAPRAWCAPRGGAWRRGRSPAPAKRGATAEEDAALAEELLADAKERAEHVMLVDLGPQRPRARLPRRHACR